MLKELFSLVKKKSIKVVNFCQLTSKFIRLTNLVFNYFILFYNSFKKKIWIIKIR